MASADISGSNVMMTTNAIADNVLDAFMMLRYTMRNFVYKDKQLFLKPKLSGHFFVAENSGNGVFVVT